MGMDWNLGRSEHESGAEEEGVNPGGRGKVFLRKKKVKCTGGPKSDSSDTGGDRRRRRRRFPSRGNIPDEIGACAGSGGGADNTLPCSSSSTASPPRSSKCRPWLGLG